MRQTHAFLEALKSCLKAKGLTYRALASAMGLSEGSIKRLFSDQSFTLEKVEAILDLLDMSFAEVASLAEGQRDNVTSMLSIEQEEILAADERLFAVFHLLQFGRSRDKIAADYHVTAQELEGHLRALEAMGLIERHSKGKVKLRTSRSVGWRDNGPLRKAYGNRLMADFLGGSFNEQGSAKRFKVRRLSDGSRAIIARKLALLYAEVDSLSEVDVLTSAETATTTGLFYAVRPYMFTGVAAFKERKRR